MRVITNFISMGPNTQRQGCQEQIEVTFEYGPILVWLRSGQSKHCYHPFEIHNMLPYVNT